MLHHVNDNLGVVEALGETTAINTMGHDWGSPIANCNSALIRPDVFTAMALLSVPYSPSGRHRPTDCFAVMGGDGGWPASTTSSSPAEPRPRSSWGCAPGCSVST